MIPWLIRYVNKIRENREDCLLISTVDRFEWSAGVEKMRSRFADQNFHELADNTKCDKTYNVMAVPHPNLPHSGATVCQRAVITIGRMTSIFRSQHLKSSTIEFIYIILIS